MRARRPLARLLPSLAALLLLGCGREVRTGNVLVIVVDDVGTELLASYGSDDPVATPNLDRLAADGVVFDTAWANPLCSPTRALVMTGRHAFRTGVGGVVTPHTAALPLEEVTLPEAVAAARGDEVATAAFGKWHLGNGRVGGAASPNHAGWQHFSGTLGNLVGRATYREYEAVVDGQPVTRRGYATSHTVDDALEWIGVQDRPWLAYVAFHAAHASFHAPPAALIATDLTNALPVEQDPRPYFRAMIEALDTELGRLLDGLGGAREETTVLFLSDNGTTPHVIANEAQAARAKGSLFEGGLRVPLIAAGRGVADPGRRVTAPVGAIDVFATACDLLGVDPQAALPARAVLDSRSFLPLLEEPSAAATRATLYAEVFAPNGDDPTEGSRAIRGPRFKLIEDLDGQPTALFDLLEDPQETRNLLEDEGAARERETLQRALRALHAGH
ncbi:MAG: sulfatase-like hydrolase/transferase [Planctomycetota bacterium]